MNEKKPLAPSERQRVERTPRLSRWILERALPRDVRHDVSGDLEEVFRRDAATRGAGRARWSYRHKVVSFSGRFAAERLRERFRRTDMSTGFSWMDFRLGVRMLVRYPGLTAVGVLGMAVGIAIAAGASSIITRFTDPALPLEQGDRIITVLNWDAARNRPERRILHDFLTWRDEAKSLVDVGAYRQIGRNLIVAGSHPESVRVAEMSASGFRVPRIPPLMGRHLLPEDEREAAPPVVVIGYDMWRSRLGGDPMILSRTLQLGSVTYSIVGVMPEGFLFPISHQIWIPLKVNQSLHQRLTGPDLLVFGRLAPGATLETAQSELTAIGQRTAAAFPSTHEKIRPRVLPYTYPFFDIGDAATGRLYRSMQYLMALLLLVICVNVAILVYARTATRQGEIAVRTALGAGRRRIVAQLFVEALVLSAASAAVGLLITSVGLTYVNAAMVKGFAMVPFWWRFYVSPEVVVYVAVLTVIAAAIVGVLPALKATGRAVQTRLQTLSAGGGGGMQMGRMWTLLIVTQVAVAVALLPAAVFNTWVAIRTGTADPGFPAHEFVSVQLRMDRGTPPANAGDGPDRDFASRYAERQIAITRRIAAEPTVSNITYGLTMPGEEMTVFLEAEGVPPPARPPSYSLREGTALGHLVRFTRVDLNFFDTFGVALLSGRQFRSTDAVPTSNAVVVNQDLARIMYGDGNAIGRRIRYVGRSGDAAAEHIELGRWYEIVGVVGNFPVNQTETGLATAKVYHALAPGQMHPVTLSIRLRGPVPASFEGRLREIGASVDPNLQMRDIAVMDERLRKEQSMTRLVAGGLALVTFSVLALSAAGIYALMSFTVSRRRKEIGIRTALGADATRTLRSIFSRALTQLAIGAIAGVLGATLLERLTGGELMGGKGSVVLPVVAVLMTLVGLLAAIGPARRGLRIQPTEALREE